MVAVNAYTGSLKQLLLCGGGLALCMVLVQAATGWKEGKLAEEERDQGLIENEVGNGRGVEEEEWD